MAHETGHRNHRSRGDASRSRRRPVIATLVAVAAVAGVGYGGYAALAGGSREDPEVRAATDQLTKFLAAWESGDAEAAGSFTDTPANAESLIKSVMTNLKPSKTTISAGSGKKMEGEVHIPFSVEMAIPDAGGFAWESEAKVVSKQGKWEVEFTSPMIHPKLAAGQTLALQSKERAAVLDTNGDELLAPSLVGAVDAESGKGVSGLQARYDKQLTGGGGGAKSVAIVDRGSGQAVKRLTEVGGAEAKPVKTTIDPKIQRAAADALDGVTKNAALVAIEPSTGHVLAAANNPGGMNRALEGRYPPGSTFKVVTAAALLKEGLRPGDPGDCPKFAEVNGQKFENQNQFTLPAGATFKDSFAKSCNTFFINSRAKLPDAALHDTATAFGIGGAWDVGISTYDGSVPVATSDNDKAASAIGQARVQASPLVMASIAATVKDGAFKQPVLVPDGVKKKYEAPAALDAAVVADLREMMRATVTFGSGAVLKDLAGEPHAKTGTAEFGEETPPRTHAWMIGYQGEQDLAWAVLLEDGGSGGKDAGPIAAKFLKGVG
ncbi:penicillin-binding transpeptidase domain-containing protein [Streptomyces sp. NPDC093109]|uniref:penicillin-binding transpeptidase domain-containing protein n=1 Tax=Streptomyces sp. NPDC093109 TaxID=3154977 RepID=UPI00344C10CA